MPAIPKAAPEATLPNFIPLLIVSIASSVHPIFFNFIVRAYCLLALVISAEIASANCWFFIFLIKLFLDAICTSLAVVKLRRIAS